MTTKRKRNQGRKRDSKSYKSLQDQLLEKQNATHNAQIAGAYFAALVGAIATISGAMINRPPVQHKPMPDSPETRSHQEDEPKLSSYLYQEGEPKLSPYLHWAPKLGTANPVGDFLDILFRYYAPYLQEGKDLNSIKGKMIDEIKSFRKSRKKADELKRLDSIIEILSRPFQIKV